MKNQAPEKDMHYFSCIGWMLEFPFRIWQLQARQTVNCQRFLQWKIRIHLHCFFPSWLCVFWPFEYSWTKMCPARCLGPALLLLDINRFYIKKWLMLFLCLNDVISRVNNNLECSAFFWPYAISLWFLYAWLTFTAYPRTGLSCSEGLLSKSVEAVILYLTGAMWYPAVWCAYYVFACLSRFLLSPVKIILQNNVIPSILLYFFLIMRQLKCFHFKQVGQLSDFICSFQY